MSMNKDDFHIPFLHGMVIVAIVTVISMVTARYFITESLSAPQNTTIFTSQESQYSSEPQ